jgi:hypothetical protein
MQKKVFGWMLRQRLVKMTQDINYGLPDTTGIREEMIEAERNTANQQINSIKEEIISKWRQIEEIADQHGIIVYGPDDDHSSIYFPDRETFKKHYGFIEEDVKDYINDDDIPGWVSSSAFC